MKKNSVFLLLLIFNIEVAIAVVAKTTDHSPSFDCKKALTNIEKMICSDSELSILDERLMAQYNGKMSQTNEKNKYQKIQINWLKTKRNICNDISCLKREYLERLSDLEEIK